MSNRCPNGSRRKPPKTGKCVKNNVKTKKKKCPKGMILNPKRNRCINDTVKNRKIIQKKLSVKSSSLHKIIAKTCTNYKNLNIVNINILNFYLSFIYGCPIAFGAIAFPTKPASSTTVKTYGIA